MHQYLRVPKTLNLLWQYLQEVLDPRLWIGVGYDSDSGADLLGWYC